MCRPLHILPVILLLTLASAVMAQSPPSCGVVGIDGPSHVDPGGTPPIFKVKTTSLHTTKPEFKWKLSAGTIATGQGTDEITIEHVGLGGLDVTVAVELSGAPPGCGGSASKTVQFKPPPPIGCALDGYGDIKFEDEKARLDNFAIQLQNDPLSSGYILMFAGQVTFENEAQERLDRAKSYLADVRDIDRNRIVTVDCGYSSELWAQTWIVPIGAAPPACSATRHIPFSEVKFTKRKPSKKKTTTKFD